MTTVRVRVAVGVDPDGKWNAYGWGPGGDDDEAISLAVDGLGEGSGERRYILTAELEVPELVEVQAEVHQGGTADDNETEDES